MNASESERTCKRAPSRRAANRPCRREQARLRWSAASSCRKRSADAPPRRRGRAGLSNRRPSTRPRCRCRSPSHRAAMLSAFAAASSPRNLRRVGRAAPSLHLRRHSGFTASIIDAGGIEHLAADCAGGSEDQGQSNNLVEKRRADASAALGTGSTGHFRASAERLIRRFIHGDKFHPQPVNHGRNRLRLAHLSESAAMARLLAIPGAAPKPRCPAPNHIHQSLDSKYI